LHAFRRVEHPLLRRDARLDSHVLVVRSGRTVREQDGALGEQFVERAQRLSASSSVYVIETRFMIPCSS
jgi:hypothetical protein